MNKPSCVTSAPRIGLTPSLQAICASTYVPRIGGPDRREIQQTGSAHTELRLPRRRRGQNSTHTSKEAVDAVRVLASICADQFIASFLNRNGLRTGRGNR